MLWSAFACACMCVCGFIFMKQALPSHTVGVSRSSSLAINHSRQLISAQSACERSACVCMCERACICMCVFDHSYSHRFPVAAHWIRSGLCWWLSKMQHECIIGDICTAATKSVIDNSLCGYCKQFIVWWQAPTWVVEYLVSGKHEIFIINILMY